MLSGVNMAEILVKILAGHVDPPYGFKNLNTSGLVIRYLIFISRS